MISLGSGEVGVLKFMVKKIFKVTGEEAHF